MEMKEIELDQETTRATRLQRPFGSAIGIEISDPTVDCGGSK